MTAEQAICPDCGELSDVSDLAVQSVGFCVAHSGVLRSMAIQAGFGDEVDLTPEQKLQRVTDDTPDIVTTVESVIIFKTANGFGAHPFFQHEGCPMCVLESALSRTFDEVASSRRRKN